MCRESVIALFIATRGPRGRAAISYDRAQDGIRASIALVGEDFCKDWRIRLRTLNPGENQISETLTQSLIHHPHDVYCDTDQQARY